MGYLVPIIFEIGSGRRVRPPGWKIARPGDTWGAAGGSFSYSAPP